MCLASVRAEQSDCRSHWSPFPIYHHLLQSLSHLRASREAWWRSSSPHYLTWPDHVSVCWASVCLSVSIIIDLCIIRHVCYWPCGQCGCLSPSYAAHVQVQLVSSCWSAERQSMTLETYTAHRQISNEYHHQAITNSTATESTKRQI